jgi:putative phage-type endonuclease
VHEAARLAVDWRGVVSAVVAVRQRLGKGLGASEIAAALGLSRWKAPITLWLEKTGRQAPTPAGEPAEWGTKLEPIIRAEYIERHGVEVRIPKQSEYHPSIPWARATVDGYVYAADETGALVRSHLLEVKAPGLRMADDWGDADEPEVPDYYYVQAVWQMFVTGMRRDDFAVLLGGQTYFERVVHHDAELEAEIVAGATEFMRLVETNTPPDVDASEAHAKYLRSLVKYTEKPIEAPADVDAMAVKWRDLVQASARIEEETDLLRNRLLARCVDLGASKLKTSVGMIGVSKPGTTSRTDYKAVATDLATRLQLLGERVDLSEELAKRTTTTPVDGSLRRPTNWKKETK